MAVVGWEGFDLMTKTWPEWKTQFTEVYELRKVSEIMTGQAGYHRAVRAHDNVERSPKRCLAQLQLENYTAMQWGAMRKL